jgi:hypothetical protein
LIEVAIYKYGKVWEYFIRRPRDEESRLIAPGLSGNEAIIRETPE